MSPAGTDGASTDLGATNGPWASLVRSGRFLFTYRKFVLPLISVGILLVSKPGLLLGSQRWDLLLDGVGIAVALAGQTLRALVIGLAYIKRGGNRGTIDADSLVVQGLFAHSRNPLYVGNMLEFLGLCLILHSPAGYLIGVPFFALAYFSIVLAEEEFLRAKFGPVYEEYCRRVNRFVPSLRGLGATLGSMELDWRRVIRKEYGTTFVWVSTLLALLAWERIFHRGWPSAQAGVRVLLLLWGLVVLAYLAARYLKKTDRLGCT